MNSFPRAVTPLSKLMIVARITILTPCNCQISIKILLITSIYNIKTHRPNQRIKAYWWATASHNSSLLKIDAHLKAQVLELNITQLTSQ